MRTIVENIILILISPIILAIAIPKDNNDTNALDSKENFKNIEIPAPINGKAEQIINHIGYTVSYNADWKIPNWVAYELTAQKVNGTYPRYNTFMPDPEVPSNKTATTEDYSHSGWDRGHMAPAGDMKWSEQAMRESFYLSNICPQNRNMNSGVWHDLEIHIRDLAKHKGNIYVVCGPIISKNPKTIGNNKVAIPDAFFKVLLMKSNNQWNSIAFLYANSSGRKPMSSYAMSVDELELITDIDFFPSLPDEEENSAEETYELTKWNIKQ